MNRLQLITMPFCGNVRTGPCIHSGSSLVSVLRGSRDTAVFPALSSWPSCRVHAANTATKRSSCISRTPQCVDTRLVPVRTCTFQYPTLRFSLEVSTPKTDEIHCPIIDGLQAFDISMYVYWVTFAEHTKKCLGFTYGSHAP